MQEDYQRLTAEKKLEQKAMAPMRAISGQIRLDRPANALE